MYGCTLVYTIHPQSHMISNSSVTTDNTNLWELLVGCERIKWRYFSRFDIIQELLFHTDRTDGQTERCIQLLPSS